MKFKQHGKRPDWRALLAVWLTLAFLTAAGFAANCAWQTSRIGFAVHFVDVGQGDGAIVVCDGKTLVIDGGTAENGDGRCSTGWMSGWTGWRFEQWQESW